MKSLFFFLFDRYFRIGWRGPKKRRIIHPPPPSIEELNARLGGGGEDDEAAVMSMDERRKMDFYFSYSFTWYEFEDVNRR